VLVGQALLRFPVFSETVEKCDKILQTHGMHVIDILTGKHGATFNNILNSFIGITVMQVINLYLYKGDCSLPIPQLLCT